MTSRQEASYANSGPRVVSQKLIVTHGIHNSVVLTTLQDSNSVLPAIATHDIRDFAVSCFDIRGRTWLPSCSDDLTLQRVELDGNSFTQ